MFQYILAYIHMLRIKKRVSGEKQKRLCSLLGQHIGMAPAFCVVGGVHLLLLLLFFFYHEKWIERPLVHFLANLLLSK